MAWMWIVFSTHYPLAVVISDSCNELDSYLSGEQHNPALDMILKCSNISEFQALRNLAEEALQKATDTGCSAVTEYCTLKVPISP